MNETLSWATILHFGPPGKSSYAAHSIPRPAQPHSPDSRDPLTRDPRGHALLGLPVGPTCHLYLFPLLRCFCFLSASTTRTPCADLSLVLRGWTTSPTPRTQGIKVGRAHDLPSSIASIPLVLCSSPVPP